MFKYTFVAHSEKRRELFLQFCGLVVLYFSLVGLVCTIYINQFQRNFQPLKLPSFFFRYFPLVIFYWMTGGDPKGADQKAADSCRSASRESESCESQS